MTRGARESSPRHMIRKHSPKQRSHHRRDPENRSNKPLINWSFGERNDVHHNHNRPGENPRVSQPREGAPNDENGGTRRGAADGGSDFKETDGDQKDPFRVVERVESSEEELRGALSEQVGTPVPAGVNEGVEFIRDTRNGGRDDGTILHLRSVSVF